MGGIVRIAIVVAVVGCAANDAQTTLPPTVLSSPGPLIVGHAELDAQSACNSCHVDNTAALDANKCAACHRQLSQRSAQNRGFHASAVVRDKPCETCHMDHRGRGYDPMGWRSMKGGRDGFDHALTGWPLDDAHRTTACRDCHTARDKQGLETYVGTDTPCGSCHSSPHNFTKSALEACDRCHSEAAWQPPLLRPQFNHDNRLDARMPLLGAHAKVACRECHANGLFNLGVAQPDRCENCHDSPHIGGIYGKGDCMWCHSPTFKSFDKTIFDHTEKTRFDLGGHKNLPCARCHPASLGKQMPPRACETCHADRSPHGNRFAFFGSPPACAKCHSTSFGTPPRAPWRPKGFDHSKNTVFPLVGKHAELACRACHTGSSPSSFEKLDIKKGCMGCHTHENVHDKKYKNDQCVLCHVPSSF